MKEKRKVILIERKEKFSKSYHIISHTQPAPFIQYFSCTRLMQEPIQTTSAVKTQEVNFSTVVKSRFKLRIKILILLNWKELNIIFQHNRHYKKIRGREGSFLREQWKNLDKYSVTIDKFGGWVTAPIKRTIFGWRRRFIIAT